ncbi:hypothetical protein [Flavobacterium sp. FlaQc-50]|uniref:hypothetical protein n=1 Tax=unclassified Flavobacterium TaxID=196869 RepID=UPI003757BE72
MKSKETRNQARIEILNFIIQFCTVKCFGPNSFSFGEEKTSFHGSHFNKQDPPIGSLCMLQSAPTSVYYLGWLRDIKASESRFSTQFLIESIEDGTRCWWSNVGIWHLPLEQTDKFPEWQWTDKQFAFKKKWHNCFKRRSAYGLRSLNPVFNEDGSVTLMIRKMWSNDIFKEKTFESWKKVLSKQLLEFYDETLIEYNKK